MHASSAVQPAAWPDDLPQEIRDSWAGRIVVIDFWATWCSPCIASAPNVQILHEKYETDDGVLVVAVHADDGVEESPTQFVRAKGHTYPVVDKGQAIKLALDVYGLPTFVVLDHQGREVHRHAGMLSLRARQDIESVVQGLDIAGTNR